MAHFRFEFYPKSLGRRFCCELVIPSLNLRESISSKDSSFYQNRDEKFPLMIFLCGFGDNELSWQRNTSIVEECEKNKIAALFVNGENSWYLNNGPITNYYSLIENDLLDFVYGNFKNLSKEKGVGIAGVSMGGYGALFHYLKNIEKYRCCVALSPATRPDYIDESKIGGTLKENFLANKGKKMNIYLSIGEKDFIIDASKEFNSWFKENDLDVSYKFIPGCDHSWPTWDKEVSNVIAYLKNIGFIS